MDKDFPCNQMPVNNNFRRGFTNTFSKETEEHCPHCNAFIRKSDSTCWSCKKDLSPKQRRLFK